jgi:hypothetical protein
MEVQTVRMTVARWWGGLEVQTGAVMELQTVRMTVVGRVGSASTIFKLHTFNNSTQTVKYHRIPVQIPRDTLGFARAFCIEGENIGIFNTGWQKSK